MVMGKNCVADWVLLKLYSFINWDVIFFCIYMAIFQFEVYPYVPAFSNGAAWYAVIASPHELFTNGEFGSLLKCIRKCNVSIVFPNL